MLQVCQLGAGAFTHRADKSFREERPHDPRLTSVTAQDAANSSWNGQLKIVHRLRLGADTKNAIRKNIASPNMAVIAASQRPDDDVSGPRHSREH